MLRSLPRALTLSTLLLASCVTNLPDEDVPADPASGPAEVAATPADEAGDLQREMESKKRQLDVATAKLEIALLELEGHAEEHAADVRHAEAAVAMATEKLARHREADAPRRLASERLDLQGAKDRAQEAADELEQIEIMYEEQDLDDMTREYVIRRGRRNAERAEARIALQEAAFQSLSERELPAEQAGLELEVDKARAALAASQRSGEIARRNRELGVREAENRLQELEAELAALRKKVAR